MEPVTFRLQVHFQSPVKFHLQQKFYLEESFDPASQFYHHRSMNDRISKQRELIAKKEGKFYTNTKDFQDRIKALPFEAGQNVWLQNSDSRKCEEAMIREKCRETQLLHG